MGWGPGRFGKESTVCIKFIPKGRSTKASIHAPNTNSKSRTPTPASFVTRAAKTLKLGDKVKIDFSSLSGKTWMRSLTRIDGASTSANGQSAADRFTFVGARKVRTSAGLKITVVARKGSNMWSFQVPIQPLKSPSSSLSRSDPNYRETPTSDSLAEKISRCSSGDVISLQYDTVKFGFLLTDINPYMMTASGKLTRMSERIMRGARHDTAYVHTGKMNLRMIVPKTNRPGGPDVAALSSTLKSLVDSDVTVKYYKRKGILWIDEAVSQ